MPTQRKRKPRKPTKTLIKRVNEAMDRCIARSSIYDALNYPILARRWYIAVLKLSLFIDPSWTIERYTTTLAQYDTHKGTQS